jgi:hypothetical protein
MGKKAKLKENNTISNTLLKFHKKITTKQTTNKSEPYNFISVYL